MQTVLSERKKKRERERKRKKERKKERKVYFTCLNEEWGGIKGHLKLESLSAFKDIH
jgi:hypothetical protein